MNYSKIKSKYYTNSNNNSKSDADIAVLLVLIGVLLISAVLEFTLGGLF